MTERNIDIKESIGKGLGLLSEGKGVEAVEVFKEICARDDSPTNRNYLAMAYFSMSDYEQALLIVEDMIAGDGDDHPYSHALAARSLVGLERETEARKHLDIAIKQFDKGMKKRDRNSPARKEHASIIMQAVADFKEHRMLFELYKNWQSYHTSWENYYLGGAAAFNCRRYRQAIVAWQRMDRKLFLRHGMIKVAELLERDIIPAFEVGYDFYPYKIKKIVKNEENKPQEKVQEDLCAFARTESGRMGFLAMALFMKEQKERNFRFLLDDYGSWEKELSEAIFRANSIDLDVKIALAEAMVHLGIHEVDEPFSVKHQGEIVTFKFEDSSITLEPYENWEETLQRIRQLKEQEKYDEALDILNKQKEGGDRYVDALLVEANIYRLQWKLTKAENLLKELQDFDPDAPLLLFNFADLLIQKNDHGKAMTYIKKLEQVIQDEGITDSWFLNQVQEVKTRCNEKFLQ